MHRQDSCLSLSEVAFHAMQNHDAPEYPALAPTFIQQGALLAWSWQ
jgi:hypothetical protein